MALADRNIIITPNRGASSEPKIDFRGADASSSATITLRVYNTGSVGTISFEGGSGQLLSITDSFTGTIFSVNDISGIPSIEVLDTGLVKLAQYSGQIAISTSTAQSTHKLTVNGSAYINTGLHVAGSLGVGTTASGTAGEIRASNEVTAYYSSDKRLKENIHLISDPITIINQISGYYFDWKDEYIESRGGVDGFFVRKHDIGVLAQEIEKVLPEIVATRDNGYLAVKYEKLVPLLIEAIKEQQKQINQILQRLDNMHSK